tara:strand:- start:178 stop:330 length:153 start_codon:yes stop_codon:yes gene_type:complete
MFILGSFFNVFYSLKTTGTPLISLSTEQLAPFTSQIDEIYLVIFEESTQY